MKLTLALTAALCASALPTLSAAETYFSCGQSFAEGATINLGTITAEAEGVVEIYDYRLGEPGDMLREASLNAGVNTDVRITAAMPIRDDVIAEIKINDAVVASKVFDVCED